MQTIKVVRVHQYGGPEELQIEHLPCSEPGEGEVLIRVHSAGVLPIDWKVRQGMFKDIHPMHFPYTPGTSLAGIVERVGPGVTEFQIRQAVFGRSGKGTYSEYTTAGKEEIVLKPESISFDEAATITGGAATAWQALINDGMLKTGERVLIHGAAGGVGLFAVQFAKWKGANVIGTASTANIEFVRSLGADVVVDYTSTPFEQVANGVDLVIDTVGGDTLERSWSVLKPGGTLVSLLEQPSLEKARKFGVRAVKPSRVASNEDLKFIARLLSDGQVKAVIARTFTLDQVKEAHKLCQSGHGRGRIVLHMAD